VKCGRAVAIDAFRTIGRLFARTAIMDNRMNPAAAASKAAMDEYTRELTELVVNTKPAARKPTIWQSQHSLMHGCTSLSTHSNMVGPLRVGSDRDRHAHDTKQHKHQCPPGKVGKAAADCRYYAAHKSNDPGELYTHKSVVPGYSGDEY